MRPKLFGVFLFLIVSVSCGKEEKSATVKIHFGGGEVQPLAGCQAPRFQIEVREKLSTGQEVKLKTIDVPLFISDFAVSGSVFTGGNFAMPAVDIVIPTGSNRIIQAVGLFRDVNCTTGTDAFLIFGRLANLNIFGPMDLNMPVEIFAPALTVEDASYTNAAVTTQFVQLRVEEAIVGASLGLSCNGGPVLTSQGLGIFDHGLQSSINPPSFKSGLPFPYALGESWITPLVPFRSYDLVINCDTGAPIRVIRLDIGPGNAVNEVRIDGGSCIAGALATEGFDYRCKTVPN